MTESRSGLPLASLKVGVVGESCLDIYKYGTCTRLSPEAPVAIFDFSSSRKTQGMGGNVFRNMAAFGDNMFLMGFLSPQADIQKIRYIDSRSGQQVMREDVHTLTDPATSIPIGYDVVVVSDYDRGWVTPTTARQIREANPGAQLFVDTKKKDISCYEGYTIKVNQAEYEALTSPPPNNSVLIVTTGAAGCTIYSPGASGYDIPSPEVEVFDVTGAGDVFLASYVMKLIRDPGCSVVQAATYACALASRSVGHRGTYTLTPEDILSCDT